MDGGLVKLSAVIPAHNEVDCIEATLAGLVEVLEREQIDYELIVVDDASTDGTNALVERIGKENPRIRCIESHYPRGFGFTVRAGLEAFQGDAVALVMADGSDDPDDLVRYHRMLQDEGWDCAFGSRFMAESVVHDYPRFKLLINRLSNFVVRVLFRHGYNDTTNAFKAYRREVIETVQPLLSNHFNITVELPLKAIVRGHTYGVVPVSWRNRAAGVSKLSLQEMGSRYLFIVLYVFLERHLSRGDYRRAGSRRKPAHAATGTNPSPAARVGSSTNGPPPGEATARIAPPPAASTWQRTASRVLTSTPFLGILIAFLSWPISGLDPSYGLDESWNAAVNLATWESLNFGDDLIFTYGPLGFLAVPQLYYGSYAVLATAYVMTLHAGICTLLLWAARRTFGLALAVPIAYVAAGTVTEPTSRFLVVATFIVCVAFLLREGRVPLNRLIAVGGGFLTGLEVLVRLDIGLSMLVLLLATFAIVRTERYSNLGLLAGGLVTGFLLGWVATGQSFSTLGAFLDQSLQITSGYADVMGIDDPGRAWEFPAAFLVLAVAAAVVAIGTRTWPRSTRTKAAVLAALFAFVSFKHGFLRHDGLHSPGFFAAMFAGLLAFTWPEGRRREALLGLGVALVAFLGASNLGWRHFNPVENVSRAADHLQALGGDRRAAVARSRLWLRGIYALDSKSLDELRGANVNIWPWETGVAWAYPEFAWRPVPVFQSYSAYTDGLDELNREYLASEEAPERILRHLTAGIDGRLLTYDSPAATLEMLCRYQEVTNANGLQVLTRTPNRCGEAVLMASVPTRSGEPVGVPMAPGRDQLVFARVQGVGPTLFERLRTLFYKLGERRIILNGTLNYRFVPGTAEGPHLMQIPGSADYAAPFQLSPDATTVAVKTGDDRRLTFEFFRLRIRGSGVRAP